MLEVLIESHQNLKAQSLVYPTEIIEISIIFGNFYIQLVPIFVIF